MKVKLHENKKLNYIFLMALVVIMAVVLWLFVRQYTTKFQTTLSEEAQMYMVEIAQQVTLVMNERVGHNLLHLQLSAETIEAMETQSTQEISNYLKAEAERFGYTQLLLADTQGISINSQADIYNVSNRPHYLEALKGKSTVSGIMSSGADNRDCIEYAVPVEKKGEIAGVLIASYNLDTLRDILQVNIFDEKANAVVVDSKGVVVVNNSDALTYNFFQPLKKDANITEAQRERFTLNVQSGVSGVLNYTQNKTDYMMYYQPLGINDWLVFISVADDAITYKTNLFLKGIAYISAAIAMLIAALMMILVYMQHRNHKYLEGILFVDPVTGGDTQAKFEIGASRLITTHKSGSYALVQMNLQKFKLINTTFGRGAGDETLKYIYNTIAKHIKEDEIAARLSADKFGMLLRYYSKEEFTIRLAQICVDINSFNDNLKNKYILQFEQGVCLADTDGINFDVLFERANFASKHGDKQQIGDCELSFYADVEQSVIVREKEIENHMEQALKDGEFEMYLQPKYELINNTIAGAEALVRWNSAEKGMIYPNDFIPLFERNGFVVKLDLYMFEQVCKLQQHWKDTGAKPVPISVNLSRVHLSDLNFLNKYKEIFSQYNFSAELLEIEITESTVFEDVEQLCDVINNIKGLGFTCSLDDFGSGYSSLNLLKDIPVDTIKLDRSFFYSKSSDDTKSRYVVENMVDLARKLEMHTVSEGIETLEMVDYLKSVSCDMVQGYVFAKPMPIEQFEKLLRK